LAHCNLKATIGSHTFQHRPELRTETFAARSCKRVKTLECRHCVISHIAIACAYSSVGVLQDSRAPVIAFEFENPKRRSRRSRPYRSSPLAFWIFVSLGGLAFLAIDANDRHVRHRERNRSA
jgi:hypothetical protein